jgi:hypothetical protein
LQIRHTFNVGKTHDKFYPLFTTSTESLSALIILGPARRQGRGVWAKNMWQPITVWCYNSDVSRGTKSGMDSLVFGSGGVRKHATDQETVKSFSEKIEG